MKHRLKKDLAVNKAFFKKLSDSRSNRRNLKKASPEEVSTLFRLIQAALRGIFPVSPKIYRHMFLKNIRHLRRHPHFENKGKEAHLRFLLHFDCRDFSPFVRPLFYSD